MSKPPKYHCDSCRGPIPTKWMDSGALRMQLTYTNGGKRNVFTCADCRAKPAAEQRAALDKVLQ